MLGASGAVGQELLQLLQERECTIVVGNDVRSIVGAVGQATLDRCFARMRAWVHAARVTLQAEFQSFEIMDTFEMFALSHDVPVELMREHAKRLSQLLSIPARALQNQIEKVKPLALQLLAELKSEGIHQDRDLVSEAWRGAILLHENEASQTARHARRVPTTTAEIRAALLRCIAWVFSTSGIERLFSRQVSTSRLSRSELSEALIDQEMLRLMAEDLPGSDEKICAAAQDIWQQFYGPPRRHCRSRKDKGRPQGPQQELAETAWLRQRSADIAAASAAFKSELGNVSEPELGQGLWHASHDAYTEFAKSKRDKRLFETIEMGAALSREVTADVLRSKAAHDEQQEVTARDYVRDQQRKRQKLAAPPSASFSFAGSLVWLDGGLTKASLGGAHAARDLGCQFVSEVKGASIVVCRSNPSQPSSLEAVWNLALLGGHSCSADFFTSAGRQGSALCFLAATKSGPRSSVFVSPLFTSRHIRIADIISYRSLVDGSKWELVHTQIEFLTRVARANRAKKQNTVVAFPVDSEMSSAEFAACRRKYTFASALDALLQVDPVATHSGLQV